LFGLVSYNKTGSVHIMIHWAAFMQPLCSGIAKSVTYSECVFVALGVQYAMCMLHIIICGLPRRTVRYFSILSHKGRIF